LQATIFLVYETILTFAMTSQKLLVVIYSTCQCLCYNFLKPSKLKRHRNWSRKKTHDSVETFKAKIARCDL